MLTGIEKSTLREKLNAYEGNIPHMYLDSKGYVTIGVGHMIPNVEAAQKLNLVVAGGERAGARATKEQIKTDYETVRKQSSGAYAYTYKEYTKLILTVTEVNKLTNQHIKSFYTELKWLYPDFDDYPGKVRLALFDMIFTLGMTALRQDWPKLNKAVKEKKWAAAATESHRKSKMSDARNNYVKVLFEDAAKDVKQASLAKKTVNTVQ
ncbi:hypothetical protein JYT31_02990 [Beggiatoa alba]|nr:hypothetical protein [Beggiatoa alba]